MRTNLWLGCIVLQGLLASRSGRGLERFPFFHGYVLFQAIASPIALTFWALSLAGAYFAAFYVAAIVSDMLLMMAAYEIFQQVFGPRRALPATTYERTWAMAAMAFTGALAIGVVAHAVRGGAWTRTMVTMEQVMTVAAWAVFAILVAYSFMLRIAWPRRAAGIAAGFVLYLTAAVVAVFIRAHGGSRLSIAGGVVGQASYLLALLLWIGCFWKRAAACEQITREQAAFMKGRLGLSLEALQQSGIQVRIER